MNSPVRVRFAPSPTGYLHVGGARTALFNWLYARHTGGKFILRIEDTDAQRNSVEAVQVIYDSLRWLGLIWDEGPEVGGDHGPYFQSQREAIYQRYFDRLHTAGHLYEAESGAWRFRFVREIVEVDDLVCGKVPTDFRNVEITPDMTIRRPDGSWIFHFVNVVDDLEMGITHVLRGEDHLSNTPKHLQLFRALGAEPPRYAHIPLILNKDGSKMSKRDQGASVATYMEGGYLPEAVRNYLCLLGWSPKDDREKLEIGEVIALFDPERLNRKAAHFDLEKCNWLNWQYLSALTLEQFADAALPFIERAGIPYGSREALLPVLALIKEKIKHLPETPDWLPYFFAEDFAIEPTAAEKLSKPGALELLAALRESFASLIEWSTPALEAALKELAGARGVKAGEVVHPARAAVSGRTVGPSLYHMLEVLGKQRVLARFARALSVSA